MAAVQNIPSRTLLEFYRLKLKEWRSKHSDLELILAELKRTVTKNRYSEDEAISVLKNNQDLQDTISELQLCLYKEREHVLRLTAENDELRIGRANDKRNIHFLLLQCNMKESQLYGPQRKSPMKKKVVSFHEIRDFNKKLEEFHESEQDILKLQVKSLQAELREQTENLRDEIVTLIKDIEIRKTEWEVERKLLVKQVHCLNCRLHECQTKKIDEIEIILKKLERERDKEVKLVEENDKLKKSVQLCKDLLGDDFPTNTGKLLKKDKEILQLKALLYQKEQRIREFEENIVEFEERISSTNEQLYESRESNKRIKERSMIKEENLMKKLEDERKRRLRDGEGFRNDIKLLRSKLAAIERQMRQEKLRNKESLQNLD